MATAVAGLVIGVLAGVTLLLLVDLIDRWMPTEFASLRAGIKRAFTVAAYICIIGGACTAFGGIGLLAGVAALVGPRP